MGRDVKKLKAKGRGKVSNFFSYQFYDQYHDSSYTIYDLCCSHRWRTSAFLIWKY